MAESITNLNGLVWGCIPPFDFGVHFASLLGRQICLGYISTAYLEQNYWTLAALRYLHHRIEFFLLVWPNYCCKISYMEEVVIVIDCVVSYVRRSGVVYQITFTLWARSGVE